jgi:hypothetical protein
MQYLDEPPEVVQVLNAAGWAAAFEDGSRWPLVFWCVLEDDTVHGAVLGEDGLVNLTEGNVEKFKGFSRYEKTTKER